MSTLIGKQVVVRSSPSGVWQGELAALYGSTATLRNARRAWQWQGALSCSDLANTGPSDGKISAPVETAIVLEVCEVLSATERAVEAWKGVKAWTR